MTPYFAHVGLDEEEEDNDDDDEDEVDEEYKNVQDPARHAIEVLVCLLR